MFKVRREDTGAVFIALPVRYISRPRHKHMHRHLSELIDHIKDVQQRQMFSLAGSREISKSRLFATTLELK